jgi:hypothetical protein
MNFRRLMCSPQPIAELAARPTEAYLPRFRALALFGRRLPERVVRSSLPASENLHRTGNKPKSPNVETARSRPRR